MEKENSEPKWEAKFSATLQHANAEKVWSFFEDFFGFHKWFPTLSTCYGIHGNNGEIGSVRYCSGFSLPTQDGSQMISWSKERLTAIDKAEKWLKYEIVDSNIGLHGYDSTFKVIGLGDGDGCVIEWSISVEPVAGWTFGELVNRYEAGLQLMAEKMAVDAVSLE